MRRNTLNRQIFDEKQIQERKNFTHTCIYNMQIPLAGQSVMCGNLSRMYVS